MTLILVELILQMANVRVVEVRRRKPKKRTVVRCRRVRRTPAYRCSRRTTTDLTGGFLPFVIPLIAAAIGAAPAIAGTVIAAKNANR